MAERDVSPAAAAAVSRALAAAGLRRAVEFRKGIEYEGYWAEPRGDHVRVDYTPAFYVEPADAVKTIRPFLDRCKQTLTKRGYEVTEVVEERYIYGGNDPIAMPVLEVRNESWTRR